MHKKIKALLENNEIEALLTLTKGTRDPLLMHYRLKGLIKLGEYHIALSFISENQMELYTYNAPELIKAHIDILNELKDLDQALNVLKQYEDFPYFSLETNEIIAALGDAVQKARKDNFRYRQLDLLEIERRLFSGDHDLTLSALVYIDKYYHESYITILEKVLLNAEEETLKSYLLYILKQKDHNKTVAINKYGVILKVNPAKLFEPGETTAQKALFKEVDKIIEQDDDINFKGVILDLINRHIFTIYPQNYDKKDVVLLSQTFHYLTLSVTGRMEDFNEFLDTYNYDGDALLYIRDKYYFLPFLR